MTDYTYTDNVSGNILWNDQGNWDDGASGHPDDNADTATLDATWTSDANLNAAKTIGELTLDTGYTGDVDFNANLTVEDDGGESGDVTVTQGELNVSTYNLTADGALTVTDELVVGTSGDTGITAVGITFNSGATVDLQTGSKIVNNGSLNIANTGLFANSQRGDYTQNGNGNYAQNTNNSWYNFTLKTGVTITLTDISVITASECNSFVLEANSTIAAGSYALQFGASATGTMTINSGVDISGSGVLTIRILDGATVTNSSGTWSYTGTIKMIDAGQNNIVLIGDFSNADYLIDDGAGFAEDTWKFMSGTLKSKKFEIDNANANPSIIDCAINNPSFEWSGNIDFKVDKSITWNQGTGSITLTGSSGTQTCNFDSADIEDLILNCSGATKQLTANINSTDSLTITAGTLDMQTFDLTSSGATDITDGLTIGTSASNGLTTAGLTFNSGAAADFQTGSIVNNSGNYSCANIAIWSNNYRGEYFQKGNGSYASRNVANLWYKATIDAGITLTNASNFGTITDHGSNAMTINGSLDTNALPVVTGCSATGTYTIGANGDFVGAGRNIFRIIQGATLTNNRATAFSITGTVELSFGAYDDLVMPAWDYSNADVEIWGRSNAASDRYISTGTLKCGAFSINNDNPRTITIRNDITSPGIEASGNIGLNSGAGAYTTIWIKGTGSITLTGSSGTQTIDFDGQTIEDLILDCSGAIKQLTAGAIPDSITITNGTLDLNGQAVSTSGNISNSDSITDSGTSTLTLTGSSGTQNIDISNDTIGNIVLNCSGATKLLLTGFRCAALTVTAGVLDIDGYSVIGSAGTIITDELNDTAGSGTIYGSTFSAGAASTIDVGAGTGFEYTGNISINGLCTYTSGTGDWTLTGSSGTQTIDFGIKTLHDLTLNCNGAIKQLTNTGIVTVNTLEITLGTLDMNGCLLASNGAITVSGTLYDNAGAELDGASLTAGATSTINLRTNTIVDITGDISINSGCTFTAGRGDYRLTGGDATINFAGKNPNILVINATGTKTFSGNVTTGTITFTAGTVNLNSQTLTTGGHVVLTSTVTFNQGGTIEVTGNTVFDLDSTDQSIMSVDVAAGAIIAFQNGAITGKDLTVDGTANFSTADDDTMFENISGAGTINSTLGDLKYVFYTGANNFTGTLNNVIIAEYGTVSGRVNTSPNISNQLRARI